MGRETVLFKSQEKRKGVLHSLETELKWFDNDEGSGSLELG